MYTGYALWLQVNRKQVPAQVGKLSGRTTEKHNLAHVCARCGNAATSLGFRFSPSLLTQPSPTHLPKSAGNTTVLALFAPHYAPDVLACDLNTANVANAYVLRSFKNSGDSFARDVGLGTMK